MASNYVNESNAFRQTNLADTYISLFVEFFLTTPNPYTGPYSTANITNYINTRYPLFPTDASYLATQLERATKLGVLSRCNNDWVLRQDMLKVNVANQKYIFGRCAVGAPLISTYADYGPKNDNQLNGILPRSAGAFNVTASKTCAAPCSSQSVFCNNPKAGCCAPITSTLPVPE